MKGLTFAILCLIVSECAEAVTLVENGLAKAEVSVPVDANEAELYAAEEFVRYVRKSSGVELKIVRGLSSASDQVQIGRAAGLGEIPYWEARVVADRTTLKLAGGDWPTFERDKHARACGTLYAVYEFLDRALNLRFLWPDEEYGVVIDRRRTINAMPASYGWKPPFENVSIRNFPGDWSRRAARAVSTPVFFPGDRRGHAFYDWYKEYAEPHPDFFEMVNGRRNARAGTSMCVANPDFHAEIVRRWQEARRQNPKLPYAINAKENDIDGGCECPRCRAWDDPSVADWRKDVSARYARYYGAVYELAAKVDPDVRVYGYAYANYVNPPRGVKLPENVCIGYVPEPLEPFDAESRAKILGDMRAWQQVGCTLNYRPNLLDGYAMPHYIAHDYYDEFHEMRKAHMKEIDVDGPNLAFGTQGPFLYILARQMVRPEMTYEQLMDEYASAFGPARDAVRAYWSFWERYCRENATKFREYPPKYNRLFHARMYGLQYTFYAHRLFPEEKLKESAQFLRQARALAKDSPDDLKRVEFLIAALKHAILCSRTCAICDDERNGNDERQRAIDAVKAFRETAPKWSFNPNGYAGRPWFNEPAAWTLIDFPPDMTLKLPIEWKLKIDRDDKGLELGYERSDFDDSDWRTGLTDRHLERQGIERGYLHAWYRTHVDIPAKFKGCKAEIRFGRVDDSCVLYIDGKEAARYTYTSKKPSSMNFPMTFDVSDFIHPGMRQVLSVKLSNGGGDGGLWQPVELRFTKNN